MIHFCVVVDVPLVAQCVLVKGWKSSAGWGFPKGKINQEEPRPRCAVREASATPCSNCSALTSMPRFSKRRVTIWTGKSYQRT